MQRVMRRFLRSKYITNSQSIKLANLPLDFSCPQPFGIRRFLSSEQSNAESPESSTAAVLQQRTKHSLSTFLSKVLDSYKLISLLNERQWNEDTQSALQSCGAKLTAFVLSQVIKSVVDLDTALEFYKWSKTVGSSEGADSHVYVALMHRLGIAGRIEEMEAMAMECESNGMATVTTFTVQLSAYKRIGNLDGALRTWKRMEKFGLKPNLVSFTTMIDAFATFKMYDEAADLYLLFLWEKFHPSVKTLTTLIDHLALAGKLDAAMAIFNDMLTLKARPNTLTYTMLMKGYANLGDMNAVMKLVKQFKDLGFRPHQDSFKALFEVMMARKREEDVLKVMHELWPNLSTQELKGYLSYYQGPSLKGVCDEDVDVGCISDASDISDDEGIDNPTSSPTSLWNFTGFVCCLCPWTAATAAALEHAKIKWDGHLVSEIMKRFKVVDVGYKFFNWVEGQQGFTHDKFTYMAMIRLLLKDGNFANVKQLLLEAQSKQLDLPLHTYNRVLKICGLRREGDVALDVFGLLESAGLKADKESYHSLIHALHKCGRFWRAATVFAEMEKAGIAPTATTYSFVVSGFAEAGQMKYARAYYSKMRASGFEPSSRLFMAFISGFYHIGRLERAEQVFEQMRKDGMEISVLVYDLMIKVYERAGKKVELRQVERARESLLPSKWVSKQQTINKYLKFYEIFKDSFVESDDGQMYATG